MPVPSPPIDARTFDDLVDTTETLAEAYTKVASAPGWQRSPAGDPDLGSALIRIFARMAAQVVDRLNQVPDRNFLAFMNLVGVEPNPPRAARAPLTFHLVDGGTNAAAVPAGTRVAAQPAPGEQAEVVFETALDLVATRATLISAFSHQPKLDKVADRSAAATGKESSVYPAFDGDTAIEHSLYVASDEVLALPAGTSITLSITLTQNQLSAFQDLMSMTGPAPSNTPLVEWSYWDGAAWKDVELAVNQPPPSSDTWKLTFSTPTDILPTAILGRTSRWVRVRLRWWPAGKVVPKIKSVSLSAQVTATGLLPDLALQSGRPLDMSADFFPLGERPRFNDVFYLASNAAFARKGATVTLHVTQSDQRASLDGSDAPTIAWEVWTGQTWSDVGRSTKTQENTDPIKYLGFSDATKAFVSDGDVTLPLPQDVAPTEVQGNPSAWIRARLVSGSYGVGITVTGGVVTDNGYRPPILKSVTIDYTHTLDVAATALVTRNDFVFADRTADIETGAPPFISSFSPANGPALYLGFDRPFENRAMMLYVQVAPLLLDVLLYTGEPSPAQVVWEYSAGPSGWARLGAVDETQGLSRSGLVCFIGPLDFLPRDEFGQNRYWLRARWDQGDFVALPRLGHILTNTVWATHTATTRNEALSSAPQDGQHVFKMPRTPILAGQQIEVREPGVPSPAERTLIEQVEGTSAVTIISNAAGHSEEVWVRWHAVPDFHASGPRDRHYTIDRANGEVRFGDGLSGMAPPRGAKSVRAAFYQTGGGASGNRPAGTITALKTTIPYVDAVTNHEPATGGADGAGIDELRERGLVKLRHGYRAVAGEDYEDMALEASPGVARARAITPIFNPIDLGQALDPNSIAVPEAGHVRLIIVPATTDQRPAPTLGLLRDVEAYIRARCAAAAVLTISGPEWVQVTVTALIVPAAIARAEVVRTAIVAAIERFLHPLTGGDGKGWEFGRFPHKSDLYPIISRIDGVDHVRSLSMDYAQPDLGLSTIEEKDLSPSTLARVLIYSGVHSVNIYQLGP